LNGILNGADYQQIDNGFGQGMTGWSNGDFNYDGAVDGSDYSLLDNAFNQETAGAAPLAVVGAALVTGIPREKVASARVFATTVPIVAITPEATIGNVWSELEEDAPKQGDPLLNG
jgi:hypothetical protein